MKFLSAPWPHITKALKSASKRVAVTPYLNGKAFELLPLRKSKDILVVDACMHNVKSGLTNPFEIEKFAKCGVRCYSLKGLHAKVYRADGVLFVGSPNASTHSAATLVEACVRVKAPAIIADFEEWISAQVLEPIKRSDLKLLKKNYKPPKWGAGEERHNRKASAWITYVARKDTSGELEAYSGTVADRHGLDEDAVYPISFGKGSATKMVSEARPGDEFFVLDHEDGKIKAFFPMRLIERPTSDGKSHKIPLEDNDVEPVNLATFLKAAKSAGLNLTKTGRINRKISPLIAAALRSIWK